MPQELHVVQCCTCEMFQVDIVKKVPKWSCKLCGEKQSLKKVFGKGTGKECRLFVQELNQNKAHKDSTATPQSIDNTFVQIGFSSAPSSNRFGNMQQSKWSEFTTTHDNDTEEQEEVYEMTFNHEKVETEVDPKDIQFSSNQRTDAQNELAKFGFDSGSKETVEVKKVSERTKIEPEFYSKESASSSIFEDNDIDAINFD